VWFSWIAETFWHFPCCDTVQKENLMQHKFWKMSIVAGAIAAVNGADTANAATAIGSVVAVIGDASASGPGGNRGLSAGVEVFEGDSISVTVNGNAQLKLDDGTKIVVGPDSNLVLQSYLRRNETTASTVSLKALRGTYRFITGKSPKQAYAVNTSNATIGIRGTGFDFSVSDRTYVAVMSGGITMQGANGQTVDVSAGCGLGQAGNSVAAALLRGKAKGQALVEELPYILDQTPLQSQFFLAVGDCDKFLPPNISKPKRPKAGSPG
jgi:hypothetical protein